jgi:hypothetical protein
LLEFYRKAALHRYLMLNLFTILTILQVRSVNNHTA